VSRNPIGPVNPQVKGVSQEKPIQFMSDYEVEWGKTSGHGVHDVQGFVFFHLWVPL
jgi:hypothetical protein